MHPAKLFVPTAFLVLMALAPALAVEKPEIKRDVTYVERPSGPVKADLYIPPGDGPFPGVMVVHGGSWSSGNKSQLAFIANRLAMQGYAVMAINYRLAPDHKFPCQVEDCKSAVRWMRAHAQEIKLDPERLGVWGYSAGGHLASMLGTTDSSHGLEGPDATADGPSTRVQCVVAGGTPADFRILEADSPRLAYWLGGTRAEKPDLYDLASPARFTSSDDPPMFFYHGDADELVPLFSAQWIHDELKRVGGECELFVIPKGKHIGAALDGKAIAAGVSFLDKHLKGQLPANSQN